MDRTCTWNCRMYSVVVFRSASCAVAVPYWCFCLIVAAQPDTEIGGLVTTDPDTSVNCALQYSMPEIADQKFRVASNGKILTKANLDREANPQYIFYITVKDCGTPPLTDRVRVTIRVNDVNDNRPQFPGPYNVNISESESSGSTVVQVKATGMYAGGLVGHNKMCLHCLFPVVDQFGANSHLTKFLSLTKFFLFYLKF